MKTNLLILFLACICFLIAGCSSTNEKENQNGNRQTLVEAKKKTNEEGGKPLRGSFLQYIYQIQPDHKQPNYSISTHELNNGYAYGRGPYDGVFIEFFLFRGKQDLVMKQESGYEVSQNEQTYGSRLTPYFFSKSKMRFVKLDQVLPLAKIEAFFGQEVERLERDPRFVDEKPKWFFFRYIKLPKTGTTIELKVCRDFPEPPFSTETSCLTVGHLEWDKAKFILKPFKDSKFSEEKI